VLLFFLLANQTSRLCEGLKEQKEQAAYLEVEKSCKNDLKIPLENAWFFYALNSLYLKGLQKNRKNK